MFLYIQRVKDSIFDKTWLIHDRAIKFLGLVCQGNITTKETETRTWGWLKLVA